MTALLLALPWALPLIVLPLAARRRSRLRDYPPRGEDHLPKVTAIVPARDEVVNIGACAATLLDSRYPDLDVVVVDDRSGDGTLEVARALAERSHGRLRVVHGEALPDGWVGKPWACWQGYREADGELLLFTDADTRHDPELLGHAVAALMRNEADLVTVLPRQILGSFWERLVMPQIFTLIYGRYLDPQRVNRTSNPRDVIANGQFILVRREAYEAVGGHEAVKDHIVEDLGLAQRFVAQGRRMFMAEATKMMETRMYRSLGDMVEGWTKNLARGARGTVDPWLKPFIPWLIAGWLVLAWVFPPVTLLLGLFGFTSGAVLGWAAAATALSLAFWAVVDLQMRVPPAFALLYPLGALVAAALFARSALAGPDVKWKGRRYAGPGGASQAAEP